ncbi:MAG: cohesin domain-containing protein [Oscillospiraceae bacterium]|nr:cohesin domain-containing protein [Ruminococcus sp.]MDD6097814.1 cohesin domain-containing protein [Oscillospiraceae bacterium]
MKLKSIIAVVLAAVICTAALCSCGKSGGPVLALSSTEGKPGDIVNVSLSVSGADGKWSSCGIHILYDNRLECIASEADPQTPSYEKGGAIADMTASVAVIWNKDLLAEIEKDNKFSVFFAAAGDGNVGKDGDIAAFSFKIPDDAEVGTVYETGFFYRDGDAFANADNDTDFQDYAFSHWKGGKITVV